MRISDWSSDVCSSDLSTLSRQARSGKHRTCGNPGQGTTRIRLQVAMQCAFPKGQECCGVRLQRPKADRASDGEDRQSVVWGKSVSVRVDLGGRRTSQNKKKV